MKAFSIALVTAIYGVACMQSAPAADAAKFTESVLYSFCSQANCADGAGPSGRSDVNGILYGSTYGGGGTGCDGYGCGTLFSFDPNTGAEKVLYSFCSQTNCTDGALVTAAPIYVNGTLYGTSSEGGGMDCGSTYGCGTVFSIDPSTGAEKVLYTFCSQTDCADGALPIAGLIHMKGSLYGTTVYGGTNCPDEGGCGTVFSVDRKTGAETVLHSFDYDDADGVFPTAGLIKLKGTLYGTTFAGGTLGYGSVFSLDPGTGTEKVLHSFGNATDGEYPEASLIHVHGTLYGTSNGGGSTTRCINGNTGCGTVFSVDPNTGTEAVLHSFSCTQQSCTDGWGPDAALIHVKRVLYGTTASGGGTGCNGYGCGTVFSVNRKTGAEKVLYSFCSQQNCTDGESPSGSLLAVNGNFYGITAGGGAYGYGVIFELKRNR
jgi:uncharacterized repeat protein (TIGR03803 family)